MCEGAYPRSLKLFTKPAIPGRVKTRLTSELSGAQAAALHLAFLTDVAHALAPGDFELSIAWALEEGEAMPDLAQVTGDPSLAKIPSERQLGEDLGDRLYRSLAPSADRGHAVGAIGSDHPELGAARVEEAFRHLDGEADVALGPTSDGGYYLIALRPEALDRRIFEDIPWSTEGVCQATREKVESLGCSLAWLPEAHDVDVPSDLEALCRRLEASTGNCPSTRAVLRSWGRLRGAGEPRNGS